MNTLDIVTKDIVDLHVFFVDWFTGAASPSDLEERFLQRMDPGVTFISPEGETLTRDMLKQGFAQGYGRNPDFRIQIRDVDVRWERDDLVLATYTEWQIGASGADAKNARISSVLMQMSKPPVWLHIQETWLPKGVVEAAAFDI